MSRVRRSSLLLACVVLLGGCQAGSSTGDDRPTPPVTGLDPTPVSEPKPIVRSDAALDEYRGSESLADWRTADAIASVTIVAESTRGARGPWISRSVTARVDRVFALWDESTDFAGEVVPDHVELSTMGWRVRGGERVPEVFERRSRLQVGHTYLVALARLSKKCLFRTVGAWSLIGSSAAIPFDDGRVGHGEIEGVDTTASAYVERLRRQDRLPAAGDRSGEEGVLMVAARSTSVDRLVNAIMALPPSEPFRC